MERVRNMVASMDCGNFSSSTQLLLFIFTQVLGVTISIMIFSWAGQYRGFGWDINTQYSWHPTFMILGTVYFLGTAVCSFRLMPCSRQTLKTIHLIVNLLVIICTLFAFYVIVDLRATKEHFTSIHSWMGLIAIIALLLQWPISFIVYYIQWSSGSLRSTLMPWHIKLGLVIFLLCVAANLTGLQSQIKKKGYSERTLLNVTGLFIVILTFTIIYVLTNDNCKFNRK